MTQDRPARLSVGVVGIGRVGVVLARALHDAGHRIVAASGSSRATLARARELLPHVPIMPPEQVVEAADLVLLAVPEGCLPGLVDRLTQAQSWRAGQIVVHTGLSAGVEILDPARAAYALPVSLYPAMHFSGTVLDLDRLRSASVVVSADEQLRPIGEALVIEMGAEPVWVHPNERSGVRAALTHVSVAIEVTLNEAQELLSRAEITTAPRLLSTLVATTADDAVSGRSHPPLPDHPRVIRENLDATGSVGAASGALHAALVRSLVARAIFDGRLEAAQLESVLAALADQREGE